jgi:hypothetical protein
MLTVFDAPAQAAERRIRGLPVALIDEGRRRERGDTG